MAKSLQDQLLGAGLINKKKAQKINAQKRKAVKESRRNKTELTNEATLLAEKAIEEERAKSQALNEQRKREAEQKAVAAQIRQMISMNIIDKTDSDHTLTYNFTDQNKVKSIELSSKNHDLVSRGRLAITQHNDEYVLIPAEAAKKIIERDADAITLLNDPSASTSETDEDDPYADYQIPDDLMW